MNKISGVYRITNTVTGDFYIGSSNDVRRRLASHKWPSVWKNNPNKQLYQDFQKYGVENFVFEILAEVEADSLKEAEQKFIEMLQPTYNSCNAKGWDIERYKKSKKEYEKTDKGKKSRRKAQNKYDNQLCCFNGETLTLAALRMRFCRRGLSNPSIEAKKYLL